MSVTTGNVISVPEDSYRYGEGMLKMYVAEVVSRGPYDGQVWAELRGHDVHPDGTLVARERFAFVRVDRVRVVS
ncbi:hypothetical protein U2F26_34400 [Micromonospora sp. 4G57]|uniref:Uncharacterized protein n=1 Tax=Micromonospora sicca TaxID=2202420 RepID=A0ABU5JP48_9ACTN|nr:MULTISPECIES: hypothetical protein [unclassified Micromonospora]MDZ5447741.1 hypothetical protein [Micromonospora sp. 4G57]MDZ5494412.1 hypothetical protein [Micromonospora sp. 4G53]